MNGKTPTYSIVTTCKGRLDDLKQSLPRFVAQDDCEVIVVDYDCPQQTGDFVERHFPGVKLVRVADRPKFNLPEARNLGVEQASGKVLVFLDADVIVAEDFLPRIAFPHDQFVYGTFRGETNNSLRGSCMIRREDFDRIGGYDELLSGYEGEDLDIYMRLRVLGAERVYLDEGAIEKVIDQTDEERLQYRPRNLRMQFLRGQLYQLSKELLLRSQDMFEVDLDTRRKIMAQVNRQIGPLMKGERDFKLTLNFPDRYKRGLLGDFEFTTAVSVMAKRKPRKQQGKN